MADENESIKIKVTEHDVILKNLASALNDLSQNAKESNIKLGSIAESMGKQEIILEKLANIEANTKDSLNRLHRRIDSIDTEVQKIKNRGDADGCPALQKQVIRYDGEIKPISDFLKSAKSFLRGIAYTIVVSAILGVASFFYKFK